jgi:hypothetical protein
LTSGNAVKLYLHVLVARRSTHPAMHRIKFDLLRMQIEHHEADAGPESGLSQCRLLHQSGVAGHGQGHHFVADRIACLCQRELNFRQSQAVFA